MMREKIGKIIISLGVTLIVFAAAIFAWNNFDAYRAGKQSDEAMKMIDELIEAQDDEKDGDPDDTEMTVKEMDGFGYIGYLTIEKFDLKLPVMSEWDYDRLKKAPCRYSGSTKTDDLVIAAHNYTRHFGKFSHLEIGDKIKFKDMDKVVTKYKIVAIDILSPTAIDDMVSGQYDLTLFTCTYGGKSRITIRCERV